MLKIFIRLWILIFLPLSYLIFSTTYNPIHAINSMVFFDRVEQTYKGTFFMIEDQLLGTSESAWPDTFETLAEKFGHELKLVPVDTEIEGQAPLSELAQGEYLIFSDSYDSDVIVKRVADSNWFIYMMLEESENQQTLAQAQGTLNLFIQYFSQVPAEDWPELVAELSKHFGFGLSLLTLDQIEIAENKTQQLLELGRTWLTNEENETVIYQRLPDSELVLEAGPMPLPGNELSILVAVVSVFIGGISLGMLIFVLPLWKDLTRLTKTAALFGKGHLDKRSQISKRSVISGLSSSFNTMADQIEKMIKGQRDLTNAIAHDLRTPLSRLSFAFEMLDSDDEITDEEKKRYKQSIASGIDTLDHLIQQILTLSRYSRAVDITHFRECVLAQSIREEVNQLQLEHKDLRFDLGIEHRLLDEEIFVDERSMLRALNNLISNALRYADQVIRVSLVKRDGEYLLSVEDDGPGIPESEWQSIFLPFKQLDNEQREITREHGLGLAIVKQIAEWHQGLAVLSQSSLGGARFDIVWPASNEDDA